MVAGYDHQRVRPVNAVGAARHVVFDFRNREIEIINAADHGFVVVGVIAPVDIALLEHHKKAVAVLVQHLQRGVSHFGHRRVFVNRRRTVARAARDRHRARRILDIVIFKVAA